MNSVKKILAFFLALALSASLLVGCTQSGGNDSSSSESSQQSSQQSSEVSEQSSSDVEPIDVVEVEPAVEYPEFNVGEVTANLGGSEGGSVGHDIYAGTPGKDYSDPGVYTFNDFMAATTSLNWNPVSWETSDDSSILSFLSTDFYSFVLNSDKSGWSVVPEMAAEYPVDVTAEYVGQYGVQEGESNKAWKIALNPDAKWEDGTPINADSYIYTYQQLLDQAQLNRRADSLYAGEYAIYGAQAYFYAGQQAFTPLGMSVDEYVAGGGSLDDLYIDISFWNAAGYVDAEGNEVAAAVQIADETQYSADGAGEDAFSGKQLWDEYLGPDAAYASEAPTYVGTMVGYGPADWNNVGIVKTGDYELVFIYQSPIENPEYYVPYSLPMYLVKEDLYESLKVFTDGKYSTTYGTTLDTTASYGPYKMTYFELDKQITFERNDNWYGYSDGKHTGQYQTDVYSIQVIDKHETRLLAFLNGELDTVSLQQQDMEKYASSEYIRYTPQSYTTKLSFNTDETKLAERGTMVLSNLNFRKGFALAIDRSTFAASYTAAGRAGYGMLNYMYVYDPFSGASYRDTDAAKAALCDVYGVTYGPDGDYDDIDEAYDAITGFDIDLARESMELAYQQCIADGTYDGTSNVTITFSVYQSDDIYVKMFNFLNDALKNACVGTGFEGKVELAMKVDADYYESNYSGACDMIFTTWGGAAYSPYSMLGNVYCDASDGSGNQMEYGFDTSKVMVTMTINGTEHTHSLQEWAFWMNATGTIDGLNPFVEYDAESRAALFAKMEYVYLANYTTTPMYYRNVGSMVSQKGDYPLTEYMDMVAFGDIRFYTFNYTDEEWAGIATTLTY